MSRNGNASQPNIKAILNASVNGVGSRISDFAENPTTNFTRNRKLTAVGLMQFILGMEGNSLNVEIFNNFPDQSKRMTASALEQQRNKLKPDAFKALLYEFNATFANPKKYKGLRVYGIDGSDFCTPLNKDSQWYIPNHYIRKDGQEAKGTCLMHGNFLYDLENKQFIDVNETRDERDGAIRLIDSIRDPSDSLVIMDRGYSGYNMVEHCNRYGGYYVIRFPVSGTFKEINELPNKPCDNDAEIKVSTNSQKWCDIYGYRKLYVRKNKKTESAYSGQTKDAQWDFEEKCIVKFRICKFRINDPDNDKETWEVLVTNLPRDKFSLKDMKHVYHMRWDIETAFLELKYALGAINFHSKKDKFILQELYAHLVMFNATSRIVACIPIEHSETGWAYIVDFKMVAYIFRTYYRHFNHSPPERMYADMQTYRHMVKDGRHNLRPLRSKTAVYFTYRVA